MHNCKKNHSEAVHLECGPATADRPPLTLGILDVPLTHNGQEFKVRIAFSEPIVNPPSTIVSNGDTVGTDTEFVSPLRAAVDEHRVVVHVGVFELLPELGLVFQIDDGIRDSVLLLYARISSTRPRRCESTLRNGIRASSIR